MKLEDLLQVTEVFVLVVIMCLLMFGLGRGNVELNNVTPDTIVVKSDTFKLAVDSAYYTIEKINYVD